MIKMDDCSNLDGKVSTTKKKRDKDDVALLPQQPSRSAKKRAVYFTKSDSELESEDDNIKAPKKRSFKKKANAINSNSNKFKLGPDADDEEMESVDEEKDSKAAPTPNIDSALKLTSPHILFSFNKKTGKTCFILTYHPQIGSSLVRPDISKYEFKFWARVIQLLVSIFLKITGA
jgi:hypothetical protein